MPAGSRLAARLTNLSHAQLLEIAAAGCNSSTEVENRADALLNEDEHDRAIAAAITAEEHNSLTAAVMAAEKRNSLRRPDTQSFKSFRRVPTPPARRAATPPQQRRSATASIGRFLPIWYSLPSLEAFRRVRGEVGELCTRQHKPFDFAPMRPGRPHTYKYETQSAYYTQYAQSLFAITVPRAGLDCLRHYEILASGAVPFFVGSAALKRAPLSMLAFPRALVSAARRYPNLNPNTRALTPT